MAIIAGVAGIQAAGAQTYCKIETVRTMSSVTDLCECDIVTPGMLKHILGRSDFSLILEETSEECPRFARALTDFPVASFTPAPNEGGGEGERDRDERDSNGPGDDRDPGEDGGNTQPNGPDEDSDPDQDDDGTDPGEPDQDTEPSDARPR